SWDSNTERYPTHISSPRSTTDLQRRKLCGVGISTLLVNWVPLRVRSAPNPEAATDFMPSASRAYPIGIPSPHRRILRRLGSGWGLFERLFFAGSSFRHANQTTATTSGAANNRSWGFRKFSDTRLSRSGHSSATPSVVQMSRATWTHQTVSRKTV